MVAGKKPRDSSVEDRMTEANKPAVHFYEECQKFDRQVPIKPKRVKIAHPELKTSKQNIGAPDSHMITHISVNNPSVAADAEGKDTNKKSVNQGSKVVMREKKGLSETV